MRIEHRCGAPAGTRARPPRQGLLQSSQRWLKHMQCSAIKRSGHLTILVARTALECREHLQLQALHLPAPPRLRSRLHRYMLEFSASVRVAEPSSEAPIYDLGPATSCFQGAKEHGSQEAQSWNSTSVPMRHRLRSSAHRGRALLCSSTKPAPRQRAERCRRRTCNSLSRASAPLTARRPSPQSAAAGAVDCVLMLLIASLQ
mmetsp:Transcript_49716/g.118499  ORF Transcript_49716/g.118499 Transcript_49716/m.118499 type:complete len:202 (+) Transcript_49716:263-868(+)